MISKPGISSGQSLRIGKENVRAPDNLARDQSCALQLLKMARNSRLRDVKLGGERPRADTRLIYQPLQYLPPGLMRQRLKRAIQSIHTFYSHFAII